MSDSLQRTVVNNFLGGMNTDNYNAPGTLQIAKDVVPYSSKLYRRGAKTTHSTASTLAGAANLAAAHGYSQSFGGILLGFTPGSSLWNELYRKPNSTTWNVGAGWTFTQTPSRWVECGPEMLLDAGPISSATLASTASTLNGTQMLRWAGATKPAVTFTNSLTTNGTRKVVGFATTFTTQLEVGMYLVLSASAGVDDIGKCFRITSIVSDTELWVDVAFSGSGPKATTVGQARSVGYLTTPHTLPSGTSLFGASGSVVTGLPLPAAACVAYHQGRTFFGAFMEYDATSAATLPSYKYRQSSIRWSYSASDPVNAYNTNCGLNESWHVNGYADLDPRGGAITGLCSYNDALVVLKQSGVLQLNGALSYDGTDLGASVSVISLDHGCQSNSAWDKSRAGVAFADSRGAYLFNGAGIRNLTGGRVSKYWRDNMTGTLTVSALGDRIIFHSYSGTQTPSGYNANIMVYYIDYDAWYVQASPWTSGWTRIVQESPASGIGAQIAFPAALADVPTIPGHCYDWSGDDLPLRSANRGTNDADTTFTPGSSFQIRTQPIPMGDGITNGRPEEVYVGYAADSNVSGGGTGGAGQIKVNLYGGPEASDHIGATLPDTSGAGATPILVGKLDATTTTGGGTVQYNVDNLRPSVGIGMDTHWAVDLTSNADNTIRTLAVNAIGLAFTSEDRQAQG